MTKITLAEIAHYYCEMVQKELEHDIAMLDKMLKKDRNSADNLDTDTDEEADYQHN